MSLADYAAIAAGSCTYCNGHLPETGGGVDRKNSTVGYTVDNCVACCSTCNTIRMDDLISYEEMFHVMRLLKSLREEALLGP